jgi:signal transduction histidine kinase
MESIQRLIRNETDEWNVEYRADLRNSGVYEWWQTRGMLETTLRDDIPYTYMFGMTINIEEHKQTELTLLKNREELNHLIRQNEMVLNNANSGLAYISTDYIVQWENISMCSASLSHKAYRKGTICYQSTRGRTSPCENCVMQLSMRSRQMEQAKFTFDNGHTVEVFATPVFRSDRTIDGVVVRIDDVTERERMIKELKQAKALAEQSDKLKSAFLANMSHEIRTPLNAIVGFSQVIADEEDAETRHELSNIIQSNNELLQRLIEDVLDISKIESNTLTFVLANHEMKALMKDIYSIILLRMPENVELRLDDCQPFTLYTDRSRLTQVLTNLLTNAIKHTKKGYICFGYDVTEQEIRFYVTDTGEGIPDDQLERVFDRFVKLTQWTNGVGLGLAISKALVTKLGGRIEVTSQQGVGSTFSVIFPR